MAEITRVLMALIVRVGVDLAKNVIQRHAVDAAGQHVRSSETGFWPGARNCLPGAWWRWKRAAAHMAGRGGCARWGWMRG